MQLCVKYEKKRKTVTGNMTQMKQYLPVFVAFSHNKTKRPEESIKALQIFATDF